MTDHRSKKQVKDESLKKKKEMKKRSVQNTLADKSNNNLAHQSDVTGIDIRPHRLWVATATQAHKTQAKIGPNSFGLPAAIYFSFSSFCILQLGKSLKMYHLHLSQLFAKCLREEAQVS